MNASSLPQLSPPSLCPLCLLLPAQEPDVFCGFCRSRANAQLDIGIIARLLGRLLMVILIEGLFGIFTGFLLMLPMGAASSGQVTLASVAFMFLTNLVLIAPIVASLYTWTLRAWIDRSQLWATANTVGAVAMGVLMFIAVLLGGLRRTTLPDMLLSSVVIGGEWVIGIAVAWVQYFLLRPPFQCRATWQRWSVVGWTGASLLHLGIAFMHPPIEVSLWFGTAAAYFFYGVVAHGVLAWFALNATLADRVRLSASSTQTPTAVR